MYHEKRNGGHNLVSYKCDKNLFQILFEGADNTTTIKIKPQPELYVLVLDSS